MKIREVYFYGVWFDYGRAICNCRPWSDRGIVKIKDGYLCVENRWYITRYKLLPDDLELYETEGVGWTTSLYKEKERIYNEVNGDGTYDDIRGKGKVEKAYFVLQGSEEKIKKPKTIKEKINYKNPWSKITLSINYGV
mgnify:CR=1 FL=1